MSTIYQHVLSLLGDRWYVHDDQLVSIYNHGQSMEINSKLTNRIGDNYRVFVTKPKANVYQIDDDGDSFSEFDMAPGSDTLRGLKYVQIQGVTVLNDECLILQYPVGNHDTDIKVAKAIVQRINQLLEVMVELDKIIKHSSPY